MLRSLSQYTSRVKALPCSTGRGLLELLALSFVVEQSVAERQQEPEVLGEEMKERNVQQLYTP